MSSCCFVSFGGQCSGEKKHHSALPRITVSYMKTNSGGLEFENVCKFHQEKLGYQHKKCKDFFSKHNRKSGVISSYRVDSLRRDVFQRKFPRETIVIGDPLCKTCHNDFVQFVLDRPEQDEMTPNTKIAIACDPLDIVPDRITNKASKRARANSVDRLNVQMRSKIKELFNLEDDPLFFEIMPYKSMLEKIKIKLENTDNYADKVQMLTIAPPHWTVKQCAEYFNVTEYLVKKARNIEPFEKPAPRAGKRIDESEEDLIVELYNDESIDRPDMKQTKYVKNQDGVSHLVGKKLLTLTIDELYKMYVADCEQKRKVKPIGRTKFGQLRPKHIVTADANGAHSYCVCKSHQNIKLMLESIQQVPSGWDKFWYFKSLVCDDGTYECVTDKCRNCPSPDKLISQLNELMEEDEMITFQQWMTKGSSENLNKCTLETFHRSSDDFNEEFMNQMSDFKLHHFTWLKQRDFFKTLKEKAQLNLDENEVVVQVDFAENYAVVNQDEPQAKFYFKDQISLHNAVAYFRLNNKKETRSMSVISNHLSHKTNAVHAFMKPIFENLIKLNPSLKKVYMYSDNATAQYKNCYNMGMLLNFKKLYNLDVEWHFSAPCHGKGAVDGIGATIKQNARRASIRNIVSIKNAEELHNWAVTSMPNVTTFYVTSESIKKGESDFERMIENVKKILGIRKYHSFIPTTNMEIVCSPFSGGPTKNHRAFIKSV